MAKRPVICDHPELVPTDWNQPRPEPAEMNTCRCGENAGCPTCGYGWGSIPCKCAREDDEMVWAAWQQAGAEAFWNFEESLKE